MTDGYFMMWGQSATGAVEQRKTYVCYVMNSKLNSTTGPRITLPQLTDAASTVMMVEKRMSPAELPAGNIYAGKSLARLKADWQRFTARHRGGGYLLFADGHVNWFAQKEVITAAAGAIPTDFNKPGSLVWNPEGRAN